MGSKVDMDAVLSEAFFAFYWLGNGRKVSVGMGGAIEAMIELLEISEYHRIFNPRMDLEHFVRVIRAADSEYMKIQAENLKNRQKAEDMRNKR